MTTPTLEKRGVEVKSFGCRLNIYESQVMSDLAGEAGLADAVIINTCAVTAEAERQGRQAIRKARRDNPGKQVIVTGCAVQLDAETYGGMPEVDRVIGNHDKLKVDTWTHQDPTVTDIMTVRETASHMVEHFEGKSRAFVQIQQGCDHRCTFCIIPFARGPNRSVPMGVLVDHVRTLVDQGYKEVVLTGVDITDYGRDLPATPTLGQLVKRLLALVPDLPRLRLSSLDPVEVDDSLFEVMSEEPRLMPHFHISAQAGDDMILKRMKRRHLRDDILQFCGRARAARPDAVFGADLIAGFPTETEEMFQNSLALVDDAGLTHLHVFPYSIRPGTPAAQMPQVHGAVIKERAAKLRASGKEAMDRYLQSRAGTQADVLVEQPGRGLAEHYVPVAIPTHVRVGDVVPVTLSVHPEGLSGCLHG